jgi:hypothetical protein
VVGAVGDLAHVEAEFDHDLQGLRHRVGVVVQALPAQDRPVFPVDDEFRQPLRDVLGLEDAVVAGLPGGDCHVVARLAGALLAVADAGERVDPEAGEDDVVVDVLVLPERGTAVVPENVLGGREPLFLGDVEERFLAVDVADDEGPVVVAGLHRIAHPVL